MLSLSTAVLKRKLVFSKEKSTASTEEYRTINMLRFSHIIKNILTDFVRHDFSYTEVPSVDLKGTKASQSRVYRKCGHTIVETCQSAPDK